MSEEENQPTGTTRRGFFRYLYGLLAAGVAGTITYLLVRHEEVASSEASRSFTVVAARVGELALNRGKIFQLAGKPALLIHLPNGEYRAMSAVCTHMGCTVRFLPTMEEIWCQCHGGFFNLDGQVISGPPPRPLPLYSVEIRGSEILVTRPPEA